MWDAFITMPWQDTDEDDSWIMSSYYVDENGEITYDSCSDGDAQPIDEEMMPTLDESVAAWCRYYDFVIETGFDPLDQFMIRTKKHLKERWGACFCKTIAGVRVMRVKRGKREYHPVDVPEHVRQYLWMKPDKGTSCNTLLTVEDMKSIGVPYHRWHTWTMDSPEQRKPSVIRKELITAARKALRTLRNL